MAEVFSAKSLLDGPLRFRQRLGREDDWSGVRPHSELVAYIEVWRPAHLCVLFSSQKGPLPHFDYLIYF